MEKMFTIVVAPKRCQRCGRKLKRTRRTSWRKGYSVCPMGHDDWYGRGVVKRIWKKMKSA